MPASEMVLDAILNAMTKVQLTLKLSRALSERDMVNIGRMHTVYGIFFVRPAAAETELFVEYDASRLSRKEVRASLEAHGLPLTNPPVLETPLTDPNPTT